MVEQGTICAARQKAIRFESRPVAICCMLFPHLSCIFTVDKKPIWPKKLNPKSHHSPKLKLPSGNWTLSSQGLQEGLTSYCISSVLVKRVKLEDLSNGVVALQHNKCLEVYCN